MTKTFAVVALTTVLLLTGCSTGPAEHTDTSAQSTTVSTSAKGPNPTRGHSTPEADPGTVPGQAVGTTAADTRPRGLTDRQSGEPTPINKEISRCARSSEGLYEQGTTWFTDGTTGWTEQCSASFWDGPAPEYTVPSATPVEPVYEPAPEPVPSGRIVTAGAFCAGSEQGQVGYTSGGTQMVCTYEPGNDVSRWK